MSAATTVDLLPVQLYLLALDERRGRLTARSRLGMLLRAGALVELQQRDRLADGERGRVRVIGGSGAGLDPLLAPVLEQIAGSGPKKWQHWVSKGGRQITASVRRRLIDEGYLREDRARWLGLIPYPTVHLRDPRIRSGLEHRVQAAVRGGQPLSRVDPRDAALVALAAAAELGIVLPRSVRRASKRRITGLGERVGPVPAALRKAVQATTQAAAG